MRTSERTERADGLLARSLVLRFLSQAFAYPMPETLARLVREDGPLVQAVAPSLPDPVREALADALGAFEGATAAALEERYRSLFTHVHSMDCPMYETDYGPGDVWRQSNALADIGGFYRAFGLAWDGERPDHVCLELEFLHMVTYKQAWAIAHREDEHGAVCADAADSFLRDHVLPWMAAFADRVEALSEGSAYAAAARLSSALLAAEAERLGLEISGQLPIPTPPPDDEEPIALCQVEP